jgi:hypothetical protein
LLYPGPKPSVETSRSVKTSGQARPNIGRFNPGNYIPRRRQPALVLRWLQSKKVLPCKPALPANSGNAIVWTESQPEWPDGSRRRSIAIALSGGLLDKIKALIVFRHTAIGITRRCSTAAVKIGAHKYRGLNPPQIAGCATCAPLRRKLPRSALRKSRQAFPL